MWENKQSEAPLEARIPKGAAGQPGCQRPLNMSATEKKIHTPVEAMTIGRSISSRPMNATDQE